MNTIFFDWNESQIFEIVLIHFFFNKENTDYMQFHDFINALFKTYSIQIQMNR